MGPAPVTLAQGHGTTWPSSALGPTGHVRTFELLPASGFLLGPREHHGGRWPSSKYVGVTARPLPAHREPPRQGASPDPRRMAPFHTPARLVRSPRRHSA